MRRVAWVVILALGAVSAWGQAPHKKRVAVFDFDNAAVQGGITLPFAETNAPNLGKAAADLLITKLVQEGKVSVIERNAIDKLLAEQNFSNTDRTDPVTAAKLGRILGVDAIILGTITHYDYADKTTGGGGGAALRRFWRQLDEDQARHQRQSADQHTPGQSRHGRGAGGVSGYG